MKTKAFVFILVSVFGVLLINSCATTGKSSIKKVRMYDLQGTWVNSDYDIFFKDNYQINLYPGKLIFDKPEGKSMFCYQIETSTTEQVNRLHPLKANKIWTTEEGAGYFQLVWLWLDLPGEQAFLYYVLLRLSPDKSYFEYVVSDKEYASTIDPNNESYHIYYRQ
jgi:hypothetical protein